MTAPSGVAASRRRTPSTPSASSSDIDAEVMSRPATRLGPSVTSPSKPNASAVGAPPRPAIDTWPLTWPDTSPAAEATVVATAGSTCATSPSISTSSRRFAIRASSVVAVATPPAAVARSSTACAFSDRSRERAALRLHVDVARHRTGDARILQPGDVERRAEPSQVEALERGPWRRSGSRRAPGRSVPIEPARTWPPSTVESSNVIVASNCGPSSLAWKVPADVGRQAQAGHRRRQAPDVDVVDAAGQIEADALLRRDRAARSCPRVSNRPP